MYPSDQDTFRHLLQSFHSIMLKWLRRKRRESEYPFEPPAPPDAAIVAEEMREAERSGPMETGKALHTLIYDDLTLRIDRDVIGMIRMTASQGEERRFSFSIRCNSDDWERALATIFDFLASERSLKDLPNSPDVRGHFYGFD